MEHVRYSSVAFGQHFAALWDETLDVSSYYATATMKREVYEVGIVQCVSLQCVLAVFRFRVLNTKYMQKDHDDE